MNHFSYYIDQLRMKQILRDELLTVLRAGMGLSVPKLKLSEDECDYILKISNQHSILPIVFHGLKQMNVPDESLNKYLRYRLKCEYNSVQHDDALRKISDALDSAGIPYVFLKGALIRHLYPNRMMRTSSDIDVLVHEENLLRAIQVLEAKTDFKKRSQNYHDISLVNSRVHLELHFSIKEAMDNIDNLLARVWDFVYPTGEGQRHALSPEFQVFHVVAHMSYHMVHGGIGIRPLVDLWLLHSKTDFNDDEVCEMCCKCGILVFYKKMCALANAWMSGNAVPEDLKQLEDFCLDGGVFGSKKNAAVAKQREKQGRRYVLSRLFMSRKLLATEYPIIEKKPYLFPICQMKRWSRLLQRSKRKQVKSELNTVKNTSYESIQSFHEILKSLGL